MSRATGSRNFIHRAVPCSAGGATIAAKLAGHSGFVHYVTKVWIPGEGWVRWTELKRSVDEAFTRWRIRKAMLGHRVFDGAERTQAQIHEAQARKARA